MKCAICLRGAIAKIGSRFTLPGQLYDESPYVNYNATYNSIMEHIVNANPSMQFDFFIQSWNLDLQDELTILYQPKATLFEDNNTYKGQIVEALNRTNTPLSNYGSNSQLLAVNLVVNLLKDYVDKNNVFYDYVILYRPDVLLWKDMDLTTYDNNEIYANAHLGCLGDFHFVMNLKNCYEFGKIYHSTFYENNVTNATIHYKFKTYVEQFMGKTMREDSIVPGHNQEVLRKLKIMSINKHLLDINMFYKYGLTNDEIDTYVVE